MRRMGNAVRIDLALDGQIKVWILDSYYVHGHSFYNGEWTSFRQVRKFLAKHGWVPKYFQLDAADRHMARFIVEPKPFRIKYPKPGQSVTTYFGASLQVKQSVVTHAISVSIDAAESVDPTMRKVS